MGRAKAWVVEHGMLLLVTAIALLLPALASSASATGLRSRKLRA